MKPRRVKGVGPDAALADAAEQVVLLRLTELCALAERARDRRAVRELHDARLAAKRLRDALELCAPVLGPYATKAIGRCRELQDVLGALHDHDELVPVVDDVQRERRAADAAVLAGRDDLPGSPPGADAYRGLEVLAVVLRARRERLFRDWLALWTDLERKGFRARLAYAAAERPEVVTDR